MKEYIEGYYCRDDLHLQVINKDSNRKILTALRDAYPNGLTVEELASKTKLPIKTIYAQKAELYREYYVSHFDESDKSVAKRGRPSLRVTRASEALRKRVSIVPEETCGIFDPYKGSKPVPLPPGNIIYAQGFSEVWQKLVETHEQMDLYTDLSQYVERTLNRILEYDAAEGKKIGKMWSPDRNLNFCCSQCGLNHEARDFIRAVLLHMIDEFQSSNKFVELLKRNGFINPETYDRLLKQIAL
jgi:hypothetical protein